MATASRRMPWGVRVVSAPMVWLERSRGWKRRLLVLLYLAVGVVFALFAYRTLAIAKLPDVGDPFDVAAFEKSVRVPDERNAAALYPAVEKELDASAPYPNYQRLWGTSLEWSKSDEATKSWVIAARPALEHWRRATERPEAVWVVPEGASIESIRLPDADSIRFVMLGLLEGSRLQEGGDFAEAWRWHRASLRFLQHLSSNTIMYRRALGSSYLQQGTDQITSWAQDSRVPPAALRRALGDLEEITAMTPPTSQTLKFHYIALMNSLDDLDAMMRESGSSMTYSYEEWKRWYWGYWFLENEPARTRRIARLVFANRLAWCDAPQTQRPPQVGNAPRGPVWVLYEADPRAPRAARALPPEELFSWVESSFVARQAIPMFGHFEPNAEADRHHLAILSIKVAENLYRQEKGKEAQSPRALVEAGYLKGLPAEYQEIGDEPEK